MEPRRIERCLENNVSIVVGSVNTAGEPVTCRGVAVVSSDGLKTLTVYVPVSTSRETIANVATTRRVTVVATHPIDHHSLQFKGRASGARLAREDEESRVRHGFAGFAELLNSIGIPPRVTNAVTLWPAFAIDVTVEELYDQTPGPRAGTRLT
jgi:hypothetical protein